MYLTFLRANHAVDFATGYAVTVHAVHLNPLDRRFEVPSKKLTSVKFHVTNRPVKFSEITVLVFVSISS